MPEFKSVSREEIEGTYEYLIKKARNKKRTPSAYQGLLDIDNAARNPMLPVGVD
jgi:hypothetical protein